MERKLEETGWYEKIETTVTMILETKSLIERYQQKKELIETSRKLLEACISLMEKPTKLEERRLAIAESQYQEASLRMVIDCLRTQEKLAYMALQALESKNAEEFQEICEKIKKNMEGITELTNN